MKLLQLNQKEKYFVSYETTSGVPNFPLPIKLYYALIIHLQQNLIISLYYFDNILNLIYYSKKKKKFTSMHFFLLKTLRRTGLIINSEPLRNNLGV